jgi:hypothetical protein
MSCHGIAHCLVQAPVHVNCSQIACMTDCEVAIFTACITRRPTRRPTTRGQKSSGICISQQSSVNSHQSASAWLPLAWVAGEAENKLLAAMVSPQRRWWVDGQQSSGTTMKQKGNSSWQNSEIVNNSVCKCWSSCQMVCPWLWCLIPGWQEYGCIYESRCATTLCLHT